MKAIVQHEFGEVDCLRFESSVKKPELGDDQVLIRVLGASVNPLDSFRSTGKLRLFTGSKFPLILGNDCSGEIVELGKNVRKYSVGDQVFGMIDTRPSLRRNGYTDSGSFAQYTICRADLLAKRPMNFSHIEAGVIPLAALTSYQVFQRAVKRGIPGRKVLIIGASGGVGSLATQLARHYFDEVHACCSQGKSAELEHLLIDKIIHYDQVEIEALSDRYDLIYDVSATYGFRRLRRILSNKGVVVTNLANLQTLARDLLAKLPGLSDVFGRYSHAWVKPNGDDMEDIRMFCERGVLRPVIDQVYAMQDASHALNYLGSGKAVGKIALDGSSW